MGGGERERERERERELGKKEGRLKILPGVECVGSVRRGLDMMEK